MHVEPKLENEVLCRKIHEKKGDTVMLLCDGGGRIGNGVST
jgi:hypothetical protein